MRHKQLFKTYVWLVETVYRFGPLTFPDFIIGTPNLVRGLKVGVVHHE